MSILDELEQARREETELRDLRIENEVMEGQDFSKLDLIHVTFVKCRFVECRFLGTGFYHVNLEHCDFSNNDFEDSYWKECKITSSKGDGARFIRSHMKQTVWQGCSLCYSNFTMAVLEQVQILDSVMRMSAMPECRFKQLQLEGVNLEEVDFFKTSLKNLDLSRCDIRGIGVSDSFWELRGVKVDQMQAAELAVLLGVKIV